MDFDAKESCGRTKSSSRRDFFRGGVTGEDLTGHIDSIAGRGHHRGASVFSSSHAPGLAAAQAHSRPPETETVCGLARVFFHLTASANAHLFHSQAYWT